MERNIKNSSSFIKAVAITALIAGTLDMIGAIISYTANGGKNPLVIFQYIASAVFGKVAYNGNVSMILAGLFFHYLIAFIFTLFFFLLFPKIKLLAANTILLAIVYGIFVWAIMNRIVIPLTRLDHVSFDITKASIAAFILIVCIGLPVVIGAKKYYRKFA
ncbi:hypothetical protein FRZ67_08000 [Panacibacter ginsenosidivorans]|uniref:DUF1440 domain-containing protein n=1 Tax=Panacibacter ginsenosidivorans TaxID=1813871 RepID=A0A5B8V7K0_9BACT|nr:hypothetical protein [Panacibacter ginsenosidivorans]QEC67239.1 hypothetical protein FRZ67_08000 [Panacibacter ginsenosidivorans]